MLTIDLAAVRANWLHIASISSGASAAGVIKANAYGLGAVQVGRTLYEAGCREFFFANIDEALAARTFLPLESFIYVLGGARVGDEKKFIEANLIPVLCSMWAVKNWARQNADLNSFAPSAIKINTGMTRFGLDMSELQALCNEGTLIKAINPILFMSHLACADEPQHPLNITQQENFIKCIPWIRKKLPNVRLSLANSSGIFLDKSLHYDLVRPGAALYGLNPQPGRPNPMRSVLKLSLPIIQIRTLDENATLGYGAEAYLEKGKRVAVVAGGYADGLHRTIGRQPEGELCGQQVKSVGRISMDVTMFDISDVRLPTEELLGRSIEVINDNLSLEYLTRKNNLLGYEVLTSLGGRYKRNYLSGAAHD